MDLHVANAVSLKHLEGNHDGGDYFVADFGSLFHVAGNDMDSVPGAIFDLFGRVHSFLYEEAGVEAG